MSNLLKAVLKWNTKDLRVKILGKFLRYSC